MKKILLLCMVLSFWLFGCGVESTDGTLTLSPLTAVDNTDGYYNVSASATYAPSAGKVPTGAEIGFSWLATPAGSSTSVSGSATTTLGSNGIGSVNFDVNQTTSPIYIVMTAKIGDLTQNTRVTIPAVTTFTATPSVIAFAATDAAGTSKTISLTGSYALFTAVSSSLDINVSVNGSTVTVTQTSATGTIQKNTSLTLSDLKGNVIQVPVSYY